MMCLYENKLVFRLFIYNSCKISWILYIYCIFRWSSLFMRDAMLTNEFKINKLKKNNEKKIWLVILMRVKYAEKYFLYFA